MIFIQALPKPTPLREAITKAYRMDETESVNALLQQAAFLPDAQDRIKKTAEKAVFLNDFMLRTSYIFTIQPCVSASLL